ncbi:MAG: polysaccharide deacetylase family protein [Acidobacteriota bacterium]
MNGSGSRPERSRRRWRPSPFLQASALLHLGALAATLWKPGLARWAAGAVVADHAIAIAAGLWPRSRLLGPNLRRLPPVTGAVALTFDDGPDPQVTPRVLDLLDDAGFRATFFVIGRRAQRHPDLVREIHRRGHRLGNHTYRHSNAFSLFGPRRIGDEIDRTQQLITQLTGEAPTHFRAPAGLRGPWLEPLLHRRSLQLVSWTRRPFDTTTSSPERVLARLLRDLAAGDILLLHDGRPNGRPQPLPILEVLPPLLAELERRGLRSVALPTCPATGRTVD